MAFWVHCGTPCAMCFPFRFWFQHFSYEIQKWRKEVLIVMWTFGFTKHTLCGVFPVRCLPQLFLEDLTSAEGGQLIVIWLSGCTMLHPVQCFSFQILASKFLLRASIVGEEGCNCDMDLVGAHQNDSKADRGGEIVTCSVRYPPIHSHNLPPGPPPSFPTLKK